VAKAQRSEHLAAHIIRLKEETSERKRKKRKESGILNQQSGNNKPRRWRDKRMAQSAQRSASCTCRRSATSGNRENLRHLLGWV